MVLVVSWLLFSWRMVADAMEVMLLSASCMDMLMGSMLNVVEFWVTWPGKWRCAV